MDQKNSNFEKQLDESSFASKKYEQDDDYLEDERVRKPKGKKIKKMKPFTAEKSYHE